ncbi:MAG TPA: hypothetical protein ENI87_14945 [bacterium]|nr:hypothetical protein [bacterium]
MRGPDLLVFGPLLVGIACFVPHARPKTVAPPPERARSVALPRLHGARPSRRRRDYELDAERSSVRFLVEVGDRRMLARCPRLVGRMTLGAADDPDSGTLELELDLASLELLESVPAGARARDVLGVLGDLPLQLRSRRVAVTRCDLAGVEQDRWLGTAQLGARVLLQPVELWRCELPGRRLRTQGHGTVAALPYGLYQRPWLRPSWLLPSWLSWGRTRIDVTVGLDLAWRRRRGD